MRNLIFSALAFLISLGSFAEIVSIPLEYTGNPAKDLVGENGRVLSVNQARGFWNKTKDLSMLNPKETDIWRNKLGQTLTKRDDDFKIKSTEEFKYVDKVISTIGSFRFIARETSKGSAKRNFNIWVSKDSRSILLRKNILRKLGYKVPKVQHLKRMKVQFKGEASMKIFLDELSNGTFADSDRWKIAVDNKNFILTLQDVLVLESNTKIYNLAMGELNEDTVKHRRSLNALSILFALVDVRESVDGFTWSAGRVDNKVAIFDIISGEAFTTTYDDAQWVMKRLSKLNRDDFKEIVDYAYFPNSVAMLLTEKLISRANSLKKILDKEAKLIAVNHDISDDTGELKYGRLSKDNWPGHASRYSFDDTESPLSKSEMVGYFKSKIYSGVIENLVSYVNKNYLYETDIQKEAISRAMEARQKQFEELFTTGQFKRIPFSAWAIPTAKGHIAASRDIITGSYLGTDNLIQIADSVELIGEVGVFVGTLGLPLNYQLFASGSARFSRAYTHVKSIKSIKKALKEPFRNIMVPYVKRKKSRSIVQMIDSLKSEEFSKLEGEAQKDRLAEILKELDKVMEKGDSIIVSNNLILSGGVMGGYRIPFEATDVSLLANINTRKVNLWRLHITRSGDKTFQVYKSKANSFGRGFGFEAKAFLPIINLNWDKQSGHIVTNFHTVTFDKQDETQDTINKLVQLRQVFVENSTELMTREKKPFVIHHNFAETSTSSRIFTRQKQSAKLIDKLKIVHPEQYETEFYIRSIARLSGRNYMQVAYDILNAIIEEALDEDSISLRNTESGNPGDSLYGESFSRVTLTEVPFNHEGSEIPFENYSQVQSRWKGWSANRAKLVSIKKIIDKKYGRDIFNDEMFYGTNRIKLYNVDVVLSIYASGLQNMIDFNPNELAEILNRELEIPWPRGRSHYLRKANGRRFNKFKRDRRRLLRKVKAAHSRLNSDYRNVMRPDAKSRDITLLIDTMEAMIPFSTFERIIGGDENFYLKGTINGFRVGTENGEEPIISHAIGEYGSEFTGGITDTLRNAIKISQGELGAYWFLKRIQ